MDHEVVVSLLPLEVKLALPVRRILPVNREGFRVHVAPTNFGPDTAGAGRKGGEGLALARVEDDADLDAAPLGLVERGDYGLAGQGKRREVD